MERIYLLDNVRGIAFILMFISHIFYFYDISNDYATNTSNGPITKHLGSIARTTFIILAGFSVYMSYNNNNKQSIKKRIKRSGEILAHAGFISLVSYLLYPDNFVRFGILHFIALGTLIISPLASSTLFAIIVLLISLNIKYPHVNNIIDTITGSHVNYNMMDYFPLNKWLPIMLGGLIAGQNIDVNKLNIPFLKDKSILTTIGQNSLNLYTGHFVVFLLLSKIFHR
jgi:uncharacterized membrane protein